MRGIGAERDAEIAGVLAQRRRTSTAAMKGGGLGGFVSRGRNLDFDVAHSGFVSGVIQIGTCVDFSHRTVRNGRVCDVRNQDLAATARRA
jgi:hypothetical protein